MSGCILLSVHYHPGLVVACHDIVLCSFTSSSSLNVTTSE